MSNNNNYNFENEKNFSIKELREKMRDSKQNALKDGVYNAYLADVNVDHDVNTKYGVTDKVGLTFLFYVGADKITKIRFDYFRCDFRKSQIGKIASDFGSILNLMPEEVAVEHIIKGCFNVELHRDESFSKYAIISIKPYTGDDAISACLKAKDIQEDNGAHCDGSYTLLKEHEAEEIVPEGKYSAFVEYFDYCQACTGNTFTKLIIKLLTQDGERLISANLFEGQDSYDEFEAILDTVDPYVDDIRELSFELQIRPRNLRGRIYYDVIHVSATLSGYDDVMQGGDFIEV